MNKVYTIAKCTFGLSIIFLTLLIGLSIVSFNASDPSYLNINDNAPKNMAGALGANISDLILQGLGATIALPLLFFLIYGIKLLLNLKIHFFITRAILMLGAATPMFGIFLAFFRNGSSRFGARSGYLGWYLRENLLVFLDPIWVISLSLFFAGTFGIATLGLSRNDYKNLFRLIYKMICKFISWLKWFLLLLRRLYKKLEVKDDEIYDEQKVEAAPLLEPENQYEEIKSPPPVMKAIQPRFESEVKLPPTDLLKNVPDSYKNRNNCEEQLETEALSKVLKDFGIKGQIVNANPGPVVTLYELEPAAGTKSSRIIGLADDIARSMSAVSARIAVMPGKNALGIELPNQSRDIVYLREILESSTYVHANQNLPLILGKNIGGDPVIADLAKMPHLLVAGTTGSGKSVGINTMILSILFKMTPEQCKFVMIDPKMLELSVYDGIPHLLSPVVTDPKKAVGALKWVVKEMEERYRAMSILGVRNITGYNKLIKNAKESGKMLEKQVQTGFNQETAEPIFETITIGDTELPYIVVIVDEMADLMLVAGKEIEAYIQRIAQMARAAGIHLIMATQRPSVDVITGVIKANFPTRISFQVTSKIDSRTILGEQGAEQLLGMGDMLFYDVW